MDELYEYIKEKIAGVSAGEEISIDTAHAFRMFQMVCFMKQIRGIINQEDEMWNALRKNRGGKGMSGRSEPLTGYRHICPVCGKEFWGSSEWKYKRSKRAHDAVYTKVYFCSWKCIRQVEKGEKKDG